MLNCLLPVCYILSLHIHVHGLIGYCRFVIFLACKYMYMDYLFIADLLYCKLIYTCTWIILVIASLLKSKLTYTCTWINWLLQVCYLLSLYIHVHGLMLMQICNILRLHVHIHGLAAYCRCVIFFSIAGLILECSTTWLVSINRYVLHLSMLSPRWLHFLWDSTFEPAHDKNYNKIYAISEDSFQNVHPRSLIRAFADRMYLLQPPGYPRNGEREPLPYWGNIQADLR